ncbi:MAG: DUF4255 domain-containing protein [Phaeodactylibacter sp.]|nr:DUF4255 domain-containing protein [Phaeodactylibacter sp.]MCB9296397.1 DUF4255 domain-containing protein [Lewinellaceae bacterium]
MLDTALNILLEELTQYIDLRFKPPEPKVVFSNLIDQDGSVAISGENQIVMSLVDIQEERFQAYKPQFAQKGDGTFRKENHPIHLNLYVLFSAYFEARSVMEGVKLLSAVISFFQSKYIYTKQNAPGLSGSNIEKLIVEMNNTNLQDKSYLWGMIGAKYMPSVLYKVRMLTIQEEAPSQEVPPIQEIETQTRPS